MYELSDSAISEIGGGMIALSMGVARAYVVLDVTYTVVTSIYDGFMAGAHDAVYGS